jgi:hypothetical protein
MQLTNFTVEIARVVSEEARSALPDAPVRPEPIRSQTPTRLDLVRLRFGLALRRLADRVEPALRPAPEC